MHRARAVGGMGLVEDVEREALASFLADISPGEHALVVLGALGMADALASCARVAAEQDALLVVVGEDDALVDLDLRALEGDAGEGALVAVDARGSMARSSVEKHVGAERVLAGTRLPRARVVCFYTREQVGALPLREALLVANAHRAMLLPEDLA